MKANLPETEIFIGAYGKTLVIEMKAILLHSAMTSENAGEEGDGGRRDSTENDATVGTKHVNVPFGENLEASFQASFVGEMLLS